MRRRAAIAVVVAAILGGAVLLNGAPQNSSGQVLVPQFEDSASGLKHLIETLVDAAKSKDQAALKDLASGLMLPDAGKFFSAAFGPQQGEIYSQAYEKLEPEMPAEIGRDISDFAANKFTSFYVSRFSDACDSRADETEYPVLAGRAHSEALSTVTFYHADLRHTLRYFAYADGAFRYLGNLKAPEAFNTPLELGAQRKVLEAGVHPSLLVRADPPNFGVVARSYVGNSEVVVHTLVLKDGRVGEVHVMKGRCTVAEPVVIAVRKWRYTPTLVDGQPSELDMTITISLGRRWH